MCGSYDTALRFPWRFPWASPPFNERLANAGVNPARRLAMTMNNWLSRQLSSCRPFTSGRVLGALVLVWLLVLTAHAAPVTLNLKDADINALVESMSVLTGKNFIVDPRVKGRVTIVSSKPMDEKELYEVFLAVLGVHGFAAVPSGNTVKICLLYTSRCV